MRVRRSEMIGRICTGLLLTTIFILISRCEASAKNQLDVPIKKGNYVDERQNNKFTKVKQTLLAKDDRGKPNRPKRNVTFVSNADLPDETFNPNERTGNIKAGSSKTIRKKAKIMDFWVKSKSKDGKKRTVSKEENYNGNVGEASSRVKREIYPSKRPLNINNTDYFAQRKAVMDRFYARQRQLAEKYGKNRTENSLLTNGVNWKSDNAFSLRAAIREVSQETTTFKNLMKTVGNLVPEYSQSNNNSEKLSVENWSETTVNNIIYSDLETSSAKNYIERDTESFTTPRNCSNIPLSGKFLPKIRVKKTEVDRRGDIEDLDSDSSTQEANNSDGGQKWGDCKGNIVYQHNLLLGLKGPSSLDTKFEVIIQGPVCIACVEITRYNNTRAIVTLDSGGRGHEYVKLRLKGYENEGFSYIVKVWGVKKTTEDCKDLL